MSPTGNEDVFTTWAEILEQENISVLYLCGELDASSAPEFLADMHKLVNDDKNVIMDAHLLSYIDSTGVSAIISTKNALDRTGLKLCLIGSHGLLAKILTMTRLDSKIDCHADVETAISAMKSTQKEKKSDVH